MVRFRRFRGRHVRRRAGKSRRVTFRTMRTGPLRRPQRGSYKRRGAWGAKSVRWNGIPKRLKAKFVFRLSQVSVATAAAGETSVTQRFPINSLADPGGTVGTFRPYGFPEICALYHKYRVKTCTLIARFTKKSTTVNLNRNLVVSFQIPDGQATTPTLTTLVEDRMVDANTTWKRMYIAPSVTPTYMMKKTYSINAIIRGHGENPHDNDALCAAEPPIKQFIDVTIQPISNVVAQAMGDAWSVEYMMIYEADLFDPIHGIKQTAPS